MTKIRTIHDYSHYQKKMQLVSLYHNENYFTVH